MAKIKIDSDGLGELHTLMSQQATAMQDIESAISQVSSGLDVEIAATENIHQALSTLKKSAGTQKSMLTGMEQAVSQTVNEFTRTDQEISKQAKDIHYLADSIHTTTKFLEMVKSIYGPVNIAKFGVLFGISDIGYSTIQSAIEAIKKWIESIHSVNVNVCTEGEAIYKYLQDNDPQLLFGRYSFITTFLDDVSFIDIMKYGGKNWKETLAAIFTGTITGQGAAEAFMSNPDECKAILRDIIDEMSGTEYLDVLSSDQEQYMSILKDLAMKTGCGDAADLIDQVSGMIGSAEVADKILKDYSANIAMLESIRTLAPDSTVLGKTIDRLISEYENQAGAMLFDELKSVAEKGAVNVIDYALGMNFASVDAVLQSVLGDLPELNAINTAIYTADMRCSAILAFREAATKVASGNFTDADLTAYKNTFNLAKSLTIEQYEGMLSYYKSSSKEAKFLKSELEKLESMTYTSFESASIFK